jgi:hypothetical protein
VKPILGPWQSGRRTKNAANNGPEYREPRS